MKIKITKDIPGISQNAIFTPDKEGKIHVYGNTYKVKMLLDSGWAEELKDDIDIEAIRARYERIGLLTIVCFFQETVQDRQFYRAYLIVKAVIDQLNGDWKPNWKNVDELKYLIQLLNTGSFSTEFYWENNKTIIPTIKNKETAQKVIELCEPELKVLFGFK